MGILLGSKDVTDGREGRQYLNRDHCLERNEVDQVHDFPAKRFDPIPTEKDRVSRQVFWPFFVLICVGKWYTPGKGSQPLQHLSATLRHASRHFRAVKCERKVYPEIGAMGKF